MIRFSEEDARPMGRVSRGVRGIKLEDGDYVVGMSINREGGKVLVISENGFGKRTEMDEYKLQSRGGKGTTTYKISEQTGNVSGFSVVTEDDDIILITSEGVIIRMGCEEISTFGRVTKGVRLMRLGEGVKIVSGSEIAKEQDAPEEENAENSENGETTESTEIIETTEE